VGPAERARTKPLGPGQQMGLIASLGRRLAGGQVVGPGGEAAGGGQLAVDGHDLVVDQDADHAFVPAHLHLAADIAVGHRVVGPVDLHVAVGVDLAGAEAAEGEVLGRQGSQGRPLELHKPCPDLAA
jgi:hypothetical protein